MPTDYIFVPVGKNHRSIVDADMVDIIRAHKWHWWPPRHGCEGEGYAWTKIDGKTVQMHTLIIGSEKGKVADHINGNSLDNRKRNLRLCTHSYNSQNSRKSKGSSCYKGVVKALNGKYKASIKQNKKRYHLGTFDSEIEAAHAYDRKALELYGSNAALNFPKDEQWKEKTMKVIS